MSGRFTDTNVLAYLVSGDARKAEIAEAVLQQGVVVSVQVLNELANVARRKFRLDWHETHDVLALVRRCATVVPLTVETHDRGVALSERYGLPMYDAMIVAAALLAGCEVLLSEDFQDGMVFAGRARVENPFGG
jgi:predicted nucleic acid-binding protein